MQRYQVYNNVYLDLKFTQISFSQNCSFQTGRDRVVAIVWVELETVLMHIHKIHVVTFYKSCVHCDSVTCPCDSCLVGTKNLKIIINNQ